MKKIIVLFTAVMALAMILSSCTAAGTPAGLIGKWAYDDNSNAGIEIKDDDTVWGWSGSGSAKSGTITKCTCDEITIKSEVSGLGLSVASETTSKYELSCDTLVLKNDDTSRTFKRVN